MTCSEPAVRAVPDPASIVDALRLRLRAIGQDVAQVRQLHVAILLHEFLDVVAAARPAGPALDRVRFGAKVGEGGVVPHGSGFASGRLLQTRPGHC
jgi:hypothetical protein